MIGVVLVGGLRFRAAFRALLEVEDGIRVVGACRDLLTAEVLAGELEADVVVVHPDALGEAGIEAIVVVSQRRPGLAIVIVPDADELGRPWSTRRESPLVGR